jgi:transposase
MTDWRYVDGRSDLNYCQRELRGDRQKIKSGKQTNNKRTSPSTVLAQTRESTQYQYIAKSIGRHRGTLQEWLRIYREEGLAGLEIVKSSTGGGNRVIPKWAEVALSKRLQEPENGFASYGAVQQWLSQTLGVEAEYHAVYQMTRYRLKAKLKVARPQHYKQLAEQRLAFKKT